ncbi:MAG: hypothetical protein SGJ21_07010 [Alphaproteobacteria bacterium]|nr:hypothetical protein [Alphaproteobacteria bacterium]
MLELRAVSHAAGREAVLADVRAEFRADTQTAALGLSAAGRREFLRVIEAAVRPATGALLLDGKPYRRDRRRCVRIVGGTGGATSGRRVGNAAGEAAIAAAGLSAKASARLRELSPAERWALRAAVELARRPAVRLALVEELGPDIDPAALSALPRMARTLAPGAVLVMAAASAGEAMALGGRTIVLEHGRILQAGPVGEVFGRPASLGVARATAMPCLNTLALTFASTARGPVRRLSDRSTFEPPGALVLPLAGDCTLAFRPEDVRLARGPADAARFVVRVEGEERGGRLSHLRLSFAGEAWLATISDSGPGSGRDSGPGSGPASGASPGEGPGRARGGTGRPETAFPARGLIRSAFVDCDRLMVFDASGQRFPPPDA